MTKINLACIIDDDPIFVFGTKKIMQVADFCESFMVFHNGRDALNSLKAIIKGGEILPEIILLDLNMPIMDGWEFLEAFTAIPTPVQIRIYIVSSSLDPQDINRAKNFKSVNNYIIKPIALEAISDIKNDL
ncbi:response regulator [Aequorivita sp. F47161]|uniref:Response regulator n=1 Tax=Aequorivita vitellina TaxID=2874475 RepID=A0A9X1QWY0_9FLAO|nr:response regulator [Aequorivita vitellina]MCG2418902.1 response regulator [Aequorivita vitellina]